MRPGIKNLLLNNSGATVKPSLAFDFLTGSLKPTIGNVTTVFTRDTSATYIDANGVRQTAAANVPRFDYDPITKKPRGLLLEDSRRNLFLDSNNPVTQTVSIVPNPEGFFCIWMEGTGSLTITGTAFSTATNNGIVTPGRTTANVVLLSALSTGTVTITCNNVGAGSIVQFENGAAVTSYIPSTAGAEGYRSRDDFYIDIDSSSTWYNFDEGTMFAMSDSMIPSSNASNGIVLEFANTGTTSQNRWSLSHGPGYFDNRLVVGNINYGFGSGGVWSFDVTRRIGFAVKAKNANYITPSTAVTSYLPPSLPIGINRLQIGMSIQKIAALNGHIQSFEYYPKRLSDSILRKLINK